jgi:hypothetical protein
VLRCGAQKTQTPEMMIWKHPSSRSLMENWSQVWLVLIPQRQKWRDRRVMRGGNRRLRGEIPHNEWHELTMDAGGIGVHVPLYNERV